ncbi:hypothetical protein BU16DRAFT_562067 [Lophium mytilinum]|uniref:Uncharacterized protein n=1 Tax=Lophium mytilinum TaxID=390894 RepID=A0A6A6QPG3_9PEZI|nr:hypothetical protein BU16DRAFT_562067 [Lophium mytilinum]
MTDNERHTSYGIGGAGNLRRPSVVEAAKETLANMPSEQPRRRSSVWSTTSIKERKGSILSIFRRGSTTEMPQKEMED